MRKFTPTKLCSAGARAGDTELTGKPDSKLRALAPELFRIAGVRSRRRLAIVGRHVHIQGVTLARKDASVAELTKNFEDSAAVLLTEYRGLTVAQLKQLRNSIRQDASYAVVKNTLTKIAANNAGITALDEDLKGPSAVAFVHGDFVATAKALRDFAKANPLLVIKGGIFEGNALSADEVNKYASLESREVLLAKAAGMMKATMGKAAATIDALREKLETAEAA